MLRFELEMLLIEEKIAIQELPGLWGDRMESYLGIRPESDMDGVLQDIHLGAGGNRVFPNLYAWQPDVGSGVWLR